MNSKKSNTENTNDVPHTPAVRRFAEPEDRLQAKPLKGLDDQMDSDSESSTDQDQSATGDRPEVIETLNNLSDEAVKKAQTLSRQWLHMARKTLKTVDKKLEEAEGKVEDFR